MLLNRKMKRDGLFDEKLNKTANPQNSLKDQQSQNSYKQSLLTGIKHPRIRELILNHQNISSLLSPSDQNSKQNLKNNLTNLQLMEQRKWLTKKGKKYLIDFDDNQRKQMKKCFNAMDLKQNGSIGIDQLQQLLISVGLMNTRQEVKQLIDSVDEDKSGKIQFSQFLKMILNDQGQNQEIVRFFKYVINFNQNQNTQIASTYKQQIPMNNLLESPIKKTTLSHSKSIPCCNAQSIVEKSSFFHDKNKFDPTESQSFFHQLKENSALNIFQKHPHPKNLPFGMIVSHIRRKHMLTALKIGQQTDQNFKNKNSLANSTDQSKSNHYISSTLLRSSKNMKESKVSLNQNKQHIYTEQQVQKGQNVMNNLRKMWDRRMLRQIRERKSKKQQNFLMATNSLTQKGKHSKSGFPDIY